MVAACQRTFETPCEYAMQMKKKILGSIIHLDFGMLRLFDLFSDLSGTFPSDYLCDVNQTFSSQLDLVKYNHRTDVYRQINSSRSYQTHHLG